MTTVLVTHDLAEAVSLCDRVIILSKRPTQIADEHAIPFGDDRVMNDLRATPAYLEVYGYLWHSLSEQMAAPARTEAQ
jgi:NitT/TauT family transport system ATP-binding protein